DALGGAHDERMALEMRAGALPDVAHRYRRDAAHDEGRALHALRKIRRRREARWQPNVREAPRMAVVLVDASHHLGIARPDAHAMAALREQLGQGRPEGSGAEDS